MSLFYVLLSTVSNSIEEPKARGFYWWEILILIGFVAILAAAILVKYKSNYISVRNKKYQEKDIDKTY